MAIDLKAKKAYYIDILNRKVKGKIIPCHDEYGHHYQFVESGIIVDSVTTKNILEKEHLIPWAAKLAIEFLMQDNRFERLQGVERESLMTAAQFKYKDERDQAGDIGTIVHNAIEIYINDWIATDFKPESIVRYLPEGVDPRAVAACRCAENAINKYNVIPIACELLVGNPNVSAGTLDLLVMTQKGKLELWDWKTSNSIDDFYALQTGVYRRFLIHMSGLFCSNVRIIKLDKFSDKPKVYNVPKPDVAYNTFKLLSSVYDYMNDGEAKLIEDKVIVRI
jgi:hypothetical protein